MYTPAITQTSTTPTTMIDGAAFGARGQPGIRQRQACVSSHGKNFSRERRSGVMDEAIGTTSRNLDASAAIWDFFEAHPMR